MQRNVLVLTILVACTSSARDVAPGNDSAAPATNVAAQPDTTPREIYIDSVLPGNPITVFGRARTFENNVQVRVRSATGDSLTQSFTTSDGEMGHHNPFSIKLTIPRDPGPSIIVDAFEYSAMDGSIRSLVRREVPYVYRAPGT